MLELIFASLTSTVILFSFGELFQKIFFKNRNKNLKIIENGIFGCIFLSFIILIINFFLPINKIIGDLILLIGIIYFLKLLTHEFNKLKLLELLLFVTIFTLILIYGSNVNRPDAGLYHIPYTKILQEEKIILGLANIHHRFGHVSILQYLSSAYNNHLFNLEFLTIPIASLFSFYFYFIIKLFFSNIDNSLKKNFSFFIIIIFSFYAFNRYSNYGNDAPTHLFFFLTIIYLIKIKDFRKIDLENFFIITILSIFCFTSKTLSLINLLIPVILFYYLKKKTSLKKIIINKKALICLIFISGWIVKNLLISGCFIYPISKTCFSSLKFSDIDKTINVAIEGEAWAKNINNEEAQKIPRNIYIKDFVWLNTWKNIHFKVIIEKILPLIILLIFYLLLLLWQNKFKPKKANSIKINKTNLFIFLITALFTIVWFIKFPVYRFGVSYIAILIIFLFSITFEILNKNNNFKLLKKLNILLLIFSIIGFGAKNIIRVVNTEKSYEKYPWPKIYTLKNYEKNIPKISMKTIYNRNNKVIYYHSSDECMYNMSPCSNYIYKKIKMDIRYGYKIIFF